MPTQQKVAMGTKGMTEETTWQRIGNEIRRLREDQGISLNRFAVEIGVSPSGISRLERGEQGASLDTLTAIADQLNIPLSRLFAIAEGAISDLSSDAATIPVVMPQMVREVFDLHQEQGTTIMDACARLRTPFVNVPSAGGGDEFFLEVKGACARAMAPTYQSGDRARIAVGLDAEPGDHVVALLGRDGDAVFRVYRPQSDGTILLAAINADWPAIIVNDENPATIIGVMVERTHMRQKPD